MRLSGYIADEKRQIARTYLEKNAKERSGVGESESDITDGMAPPVYIISSLSQHTRALHAFYSRL